VQLVMPEDSLFASEGTKASAAVLIVGGSSLDAGTVRGIAHMISSSVKDLNAADVTITDETGAMLWPTDEAGVGTSATTKLQAEQRYDAQLSSQINAMLGTTLGIGKAQVRIKSDLNVDQGTIDKITYAKKGVPNSTSTDKEGLKSKGAATLGAAGVASNVPGYATGSSAPGNSNYNHVKAQTDFLYDKTISRTIVAPGSVNRLDVALMVDSSVPKAQIASLQKTVAAMAGFSATRGDTLAVSTIKFAAPPVATVVPKAGLPIPPAFAGMLKWVGLGLVLLICTFLMRRNLKRREGEGVSVEPTWLSEIEGAVPIAELEPGTHHAFLNGAAVDRRAAIKAEVEDLAKKEPGQLAMQVTQWMKEG
jgi:flagellar M-ring protein FliF